MIETIEELSVAYQTTKYPMAAILDAIQSFVNLKQKEDESLNDYGRRHSAAKSVLKSQVGGIIKFTQYVKQQEG